MSNVIKLWSFQKKKLFKNSQKNCEIREIVVSLHAE